MLAGKLALVTGGARGIGLAVAKVFAREGAEVAVADVRMEDSAGALEVLPTDGDHMAVEVDVSKPDSVRRMFRRVVDKHKVPPEVIVNSAGITIDGYLLRMSDENFAKVIDVNLKGTYLVNKMATTLLKESGLPGSIINVSSVVGKTGNVGQTNYAASKAGVIGFTKSAAKELGKFGIRANCICPGFIDTDMTRNLPEHITQMLLLQIPLARLGRPEDVAEAAAFLASDRSAYITGTAMDVNGGLL